MATSDKDKLISVAIDFGTTYSGYAYSMLDDFQSNPTQIYANTDWPAVGSTNLSSKTPTCLLLDSQKKFKAFGYEAEQEYSTLASKKQHLDYYFFRRFKMKLNEEELSNDSIVEDVMGKPVLAQKVFAESIRYLKGKFEEKLDSLGGLIDESEICWVLTVPAIWSDGAKRFMRTAAVEAGIPPDQLKIGLEPECASIFCQHLKLTREGKSLCKPGPGTKSMVVDLGGGTADITVHEKLSNGKLMELYKASGLARGGVAVDDEYVRFLSRLVGGPTIHKFRTEATYDYIDMMKEFEVTKRTVRKTGPDTVNIRIPAKLNEICKKQNDENLSEIVNGENFPYKEQIHIIADKLVVNTKVIRDLFKPVIDEIVEHISDVMSKDTVQGLSMILMVGGFSESVLVQEVMKENFHSKECRVIIPEGAGLTVVKGATLFGHHPSAIASRIMRYTYGVRTDEIFDSSKHSREHMEERDGTMYCTNIFDPFMEMDTSVEVGQVIEQPYHFDCFDDDCYLDIYVSKTKHPEYVTDDSCRLLSELPLGKILPAAIGKRCNMLVEYIFGDTEVYIRVREKDVGFQFTTSFELKREVTFMKD